MNHLSRRRFLSMAGAAAGALALTGCGTFPVRQGAGGAGRRPNIVLIMADDMGYSDLGCYGGEIPTPNLDRLAANGLRMSQFYNGARCCPTRASLLTGLYAHQAGIGGMVNAGADTRPPGPYQGYLNDRCATIAEVLRDAGYDTAMSGKWHVGESRPHWPTDRGFNEYFGLISGAANYFDPTKSKAGGVVRQMARNDQPWEPPTDGSFYMTDAITDEAVRMVAERVGRGKPLFLYVAYTAPHWPLHAWPEDIARHRGRYRKGWDALRAERHRRQLEMGLLDPKWPLSPRDETAPAWDEIDEDRRDEMDHKMAVYAAQVECMDRGIGRIVGELERRGELEDTLMLFLSDNGACAETGLFGFDNRKNGLPPGGVDSYMSYGLCWANASNTPFRLYKQWVHEGGTATPLIAHWPSVIPHPGRIDHQAGHIIDVMPTCCEAAGAGYPTPLDGGGLTPLEGRSLLPVLEGGIREPHAVLCWEHIGHQAIRQGRWKLVRRKNQPWELYDIEADRTELNNLADGQPERVAELKARFEEWAARCGVKT